VVLSAFAAAFAAALCWMLAISRLELSHAYPFVSLSFVLVLLLSALFFGESVSTEKLLGVTLIIAGVAVSSRG
jgi:drug/metabolite transporter (DMT)-like permease